MGGSEGSDIFPGPQHLAQESSGSLMNVWRNSLQVSNDLLVRLPELLSQVPKENKGWDFWNAQPPRVRKV